MIHLQNIRLKRGGRTIFDEMTLSVHAGHRVGVVGRNGIGKSSLFLLLLGRLLPEEGDVKLPRRWVIAHLEQEIALRPVSALEWTIDGDRPLREIERAIEKAERRGDERRLAALYAELEAIDAYTAEARAARILDGLGFDAEDLPRPVGEFSGGWRIRLNLAQTLMCRADLLLLDEPTNHLDLDATLWLEHWLKQREGTTLVISHDRDFLDRVATDVVHLEGGDARSYRGNYSTFERQRAETLALRQSMYEKQQARVREIRAFVDRFRYKASKARQAQSRLKELERMTRSAPAHADSPYRFSFPSPGKMSTPLVQLEEAALGYPGAAPVLEAVRFRLAPGDRVGLLGRNGAGKSTLLRSLAGELPLLGGEEMRGRHAGVGYFAQHTVETLRPGRSAMEHLAALRPDATDQAMRDYLGGWGFPGDMAFHPSASLSGGEKARLALAVVAWRRPAVLLLDEPTNHLDLDMRHALTMALQDYEGALVLVSHDRRLIENSVEEFMLVAEGRLCAWEGTLDEYRDWLLRRDAEPRRARRDAGARPSSAARRREEARKRERVQPLRRALREMERRIEGLEPEVRTLSAQLADTDTYQRLSGEELGDLIARYKHSRARLDSLESEWVKMSERLEAASG